MFCDSAVNDSHGIDRVETDLFPGGWDTKKCSPMGTAVVAKMFEKIFLAREVVRRLETNRSGWFLIEQPLQLANRISFICRRVDRHFQVRCVVDLEGEMFQMQQTSGR